MKKILQIVLAGLLLGTFSSANAVIINTSVGTYDVTAVIGVPLTTLDDQIWWGDTTLAGEFRDKVGVLLGPLNAPVAGGDASAYFAYSASRALFCGGGTPCDVKVNAGIFTDWGDLPEAYYAVARSVGEVPIPFTPALVLAGGIAAGMARRLRRAS